MVFSGVQILFINYLVPVSEVIQIFSVYTAFQRNGLDARQTCHLQDIVLNPGRYLYRFNSGIFCKSMHSTKSPYSFSQLLHSLPSNSIQSCNSCGYLYNFFLTDHSLRVQNTRSVQRHVTQVQESHSMDLLLSPFYHTSFQIHFSNWSRVCYFSVSQVAVLVLVAITLIAYFEVIRAGHRRIFSELVTKSKQGKFDSNKESRM
jgi:hypothetical protein